MSPAFDKGLVPRPDKELLKSASNDESPVLKPAKNGRNISLEHEGERGEMERWRGSGLCGERAYQLRALDALTEDVSSVPKLHLRCSQSPVPSVPGGPRDSGFCKYPLSCLLCC